MNTSTIGTFIRHDINEKYVVKLYFKKAYSRREIVLTPDYVDCGTHLFHFWRNEVSDITVPERNAAKDAFEKLQKRYNGKLRNLFVRLGVIRHVVVKETPVLKWDDEEFLRHVKEYFDWRDEIRKKAKRDKDILFANFMNILKGEKENEGHNKNYTSQNETAY